MTKRALGGVAGLLLLSAGCVRDAPFDRPADPVRTLAVSASSAPVLSGDVVHRAVWITPEIVADVSVDEIAQSAEVTFLTGTLVMLTVALSQGANTVIADRGAALGDARIKPGLRLHFQIATALQKGAIYLDGDFASSNLPRVHFEGALTTWTAPPRSLSSAPKD